MGMKHVFGTVGFLFGAPRLGFQVGSAFDSCALGMVGERGPELVDVTCLSDTAPRFIEAYPTKAKQREYTPAVQHMDWKAVNAETLRQAQIGAALLGALVLATAVTLAY